jgi:hypothetical protein
MAYRDDLAALSARHDALATDLAHKQRELSGARRLLEAAQAQARLPVLDNIRVATPCTARWDDMTGDDRVRHCDQCQKSVYNLSGMTRDEAEALVIERNGNLCARYYQRRDGTIVFADCKRDQPYRWIAAGAAAVLAAGVGAAGALTQLPPPEQLPVPRVQLATPPPPPSPPHLSQPHSSRRAEIVQPQLMQGGLAPIDPVSEEPAQVRDVKPTSVRPARQAR